MSEAPPRRRRFQIHLSTAIVMMFAVGTLIWANVREQVTQRPIVHRTIMLWQYYYDRPHGWPFLAVCRNIAITDASSAPQPLFAPRTEVFYLPLLLNIIVGATILLAVWFLCEWYIHRRAARKGA